jgi:hypothetical protein
MIELPSDPRPNRMTVEVLDFGFTQRGAASLRVERPGGRHRITLSWPREVMRPGTTQRFTSRLKRGKRQGVQIDLLLPVPQAGAGAPVVDGAGQSGSTLAVRNITPGYVIREDFWITVVEADGTAYLHSVFETVRASTAGEATIEIEPPLRAPFADGNRVEIARPFIQGELLGETFSYAFEDQRQTPLAITIEEYK